MAGTTEKQVIFVIGMRDELSKGAASAKNSIDRLAGAFDGVIDGSRKSLQAAAERLKYLNKEGRQYEAAQLRAQVSTVNFGKITDAVTKGNMKGFAGAQNILKSFTGGLGKTHGAAGKFLYATQAIGSAWKKAGVAFKAIPWVGWIMAIVDALKIAFEYIMKIMRVSEEINNRMIQLNRTVATQGEEWERVRRLYNDYAIDFAATQDEIGKVQATMNIRQIRLLRGGEAQIRQFRDMNKAIHRLAITTNLDYQAAHDVLEQYQLWYDTSRGFEALGAELHNITKYTKLSASEAADAVRSYARLSVYLGKRMDPRGILAVAAATKEMEGNVSEVTDALVRLQGGLTQQDMIQRQIVASMAGVTAEQIRGMSASDAAVTRMQALSNAMRNSGITEAKDLWKIQPLMDQMGISMDEASRFINQAGGSVAQYRQQVERAAAAQAQHDKAMEGWQQMSTQLTRLWQVIKDMFVPVIGEIGDALRPVFMILAGTLIPILKILAKTLIWVVRVGFYPIKLILKALEFMFKPIIKALEMLYETFFEGVGVVDFFTRAWYFLIEIFKAIMNPLDYLAEGLDMVFGTNIKGWIDGLKGPLKWIYEALQFLVSTLLIGGVVKAFGLVIKVGGGLIKGVKLLGTWFGKLAKPVLSFLNPLPGLVKLLNLLIWPFKALWSVMKLIWTPIKWLIDGIKWLGETVRGYLFGSPCIFLTVADALGVFGDILGGIGSIISTAIEWFKSLGEWVGKAYDKLNEWSGGALGGIVDGIAGIGGAFVDAGAAAWNFASDTLSSVGEAASNAWTAVKDSSVGQAVSGAAEAVSGAVGSAVDTVAGWLGWAEGGIVKKPTRGMIGEAGPEAVLPLTNKASFTRVFGQMLESFPKVLDWLAPEMAQPAGPAPVAAGVSVPGGAAPVNVEAPNVSVNVNTSGMEDLLQKILAALVNGGGASGGATSADSDMRPESGGIIETFLTNWGI